MTINPSSPSSTKIDWDFESAVCIILDFSIFQILNQIIEPVSMVMLTMSYGLGVKEKAVALRERGYSMKEIAVTLGVAKSTSSLWVSKIILNEQATERLRKKGIIGQYKSMETRRKKRELLIKGLNENAALALSKTNLDQNICKLLCSIFFWTEGGKSSDSYVYFINSDPIMVEVFIKLLRSAYSIDEKKLRAIVHVHEYHDKEEIKRFWSDVTKIPTSQFTKSYLKPNTAKRIREGYKGCIRIRYYDFKVALELRSFYNALAKKLE